MTPSLRVEAETLPFPLLDIVKTGPRGSLPLALGSLAKDYFPLLSGMVAKFLAPKN